MLGFTMNSFTLDKYLFYYVEYVKFDLDFTLIVRNGRILICKKYENYCAMQKLNS